MISWFLKLFGLTKERQMSADDKPQMTSGLHVGSNEHIAFTCNNCGSIVEIDETKSVLVCLYCNTNFTFQNTLVDLDKDSIVNRALNGLRSVMRTSDDCSFSRIYVKLPSSLIQDKQLIHLTKLPDLNGLDLDDTEITDKGLRYVENLTKLESLYLRSTKITDEGLKYISSLPNLRKLALDDTAITDMGLKHLSTLPSLKELFLSETDVGDEGMEYLTSVSTLEKINLKDTLVTETGLRALGKCPSINEVDINFDAFDVASVFKGEEARFFKKRYYLLIPMQGIIDEELALFKNFENLRSIDLSSNRITGPGIEYLAGLRNLEDLSLYDNPITNEAVDHLRKMKTLKKLYLGKSAMTDAGIKELRSALSKCEVSA